MKNAPPWTDEELEEGIRRVYQEFNPPRSLTFLASAIGLYWQNTHYHPLLAAIVERLGLQQPGKGSPRPLTWREREAVKDGHRRTKERKRRTTG